MLAEPSDQLHLLELAHLDAEVARVTHAARSLPEHKEIESLMEARQNAAEALVEATTVLGDVEEALGRAEQDLVPVRQRLERDEKRINDGSVSDGKTLRGLQDEVEHLQRRIGDLEEAQLEIMAQHEAATASKARLEEQKATIETSLRQVVDERNQKVSTLAQEAKVLQKEREAKAQGVPDDLLKLYEKLRSASGRGAAKLTRGRCSGCQLEIPVSDLDAYRKAPENQVLRCVECDRILVRTPESGL